MITITITLQDGRNFDTFTPWICKFLMRPALKAYTSLQTVLFDSVVRKRMDQAVIQS